VARRYENPPVVEALCELNFEPGQPWDGALPGLVYNEIKERFPKRRQHQMVQFGIKLQGGEPSSMPLPQPTPEIFARLQFLSEDERTLIQIAPDVLTINKLRPYSSWNELKPLIFYAIENYKRAAKPKAIRTIGLRYLNRIEIPSDEVDIEEYLLATPRIPAPLPQRLNVWLQRSEIPLDNSGVLVIQAGSIRETNQVGVAFLLDLYFATTGDPIPVEAVDSRLETAHESLSNAFEACITDSSRKLFRPID
jgi:uncharacterized protein (TIGR04255 family)